MMSTPPPYWWAMILALCGVITTLTTVISYLYRDNAKRSDQRLEKMEEREEKWLTAQADTSQEIVRTQNAIFNLVKEVAAQSQEEHISREVEKRVAARTARAGKAPP